MNTRPIVTRLTEKEIKVIDSAAKKSKQSRCQFIAKSVFDKAQEILRYK